MKKFILCSLFTVLCALSGAAQSDDYHKFEVFGGYSNNQVDVGSDPDAREFFSDRLSFNGFNASVVGNVSRFVGLKFDVSGHYKSETVSVPGTNINAKTDFSLYNFLGGVQIKNNSKERRVKPFAHALAGVGRIKADIGGTLCSTPGVGCSSASETGFAAAIGGGLDIRASRRVSIRAIQLDYNPIRINGETSNNIRIGVGIVFH